MRKKPTEKMLDKAFENKIKSSEAFASWFLNKTKFSNRPCSLAFSRSNNPWYTGIWKGKKRDSETGVLLVFEDRTAKEHFAIHIENKIGSRFTEDQPEIYHQRASDWINRPKYKNYQDFEVVLIAPRAYYESNLEKAKIFHHYVSHEEISRFIPEFGAAGITSP